MITLDANLDIDSAINELYYLKNECDLVDPIQVYNKEWCNTPTYKRGSKRIDTTFMSSWLCVTVNHLTYLPYDSFMNSDHGALVIDLDFPRLFGKDNICVGKISNRNLVLKEPKGVIKYIIYVEEHIKKHNIIEPIEKVIRTYHHLTRTAYEDHFIMNSRRK